MVTKAQNNGYHMPFRKGTLKWNKWQFSSTNALGCPCQQLLRILLSGHLKERKQHTQKKIIIELLLFAVLWAFDDIAVYEGSTVSAVTDLCMPSWRLYRKSPTHEPSCCRLSEMRTHACVLAALYPCVQYFARYYTVRVKMFSLLLCVCVFMYVLFA